ncbi:protein E30A [Elephant endotheliotropic herpesvirus 3A]|uniref:Protein E30A n=1 Tax=Elephant endotheliotropic herpesvirus 3A TaxID=1329409 RepID=A0A866VSF1_9BETA|nr:protein E30A [Elephant endotheliotropic herpesvirus 3A]QOE74405.1 protein E30A [Elephant endotheliotropic herpesvirus 3A]
MSTGVVVYWLVFYMGFVKYDEKDVVDDKRMDALQSDESQEVESDEDRLKSSSDAGNGDYYYDPLLYDDYYYDNTTIHNETDRNITNYNYEYYANMNGTDEISGSGYYYPWPNGYVNSPGHESYYYSNGVDDDYDYAQESIYDALHEL